MLRGEKFGLNIERRSTCRYNLNGKRGKLLWFQLFHHKEADGIIKYNEIGVYSFIQDAHSQKLKQNKDGVPEMHGLAERIRERSALIGIAWMAEKLGDKI